MTAPEPTPTVEHTDAVARVVAGLLDGVTGLTFSLLL